MWFHRHLVSLLLQRNGHLIQGIFQPHYVIGVDDALCSHLMRYTLLTVGTTLFPGMMPLWRLTSDQRLYLAWPALCSLKPLPSLRWRSVCTSASHFCHTCMFPTAAVWLAVYLIRITVYEHLLRCPHCFKTNERRWWTDFCQWCGDVKSANGRFCWFHVTLEKWTASWNMTTLQSGARWSQTGLCVGSNYLHLQIFSGWKMRPVSGRSKRHTASVYFCNENTESHVSEIKEGRTTRKTSQRENRLLI